MTRPAWLDGCGSWSAPVPTWVEAARGPNGIVVSVGARWLLAVYWQRADAPSKRQPGHQRVDRPELSQARVAELAGMSLRTVQGWDAELRRAGLAARPAGERSGAVVLADLESTGYLAATPATGCGSPPQRAADVENTTPAAGCGNPRNGLRVTPATGCGSSKEDPIKTRSPNLIADARASHAPSAGSNPVSPVEAAIAELEQLARDDYPLRMVVIESSMWATGLRRCGAELGLEASEIVGLTRSLVAQLHALGSKGQQQAHADHTSRDRSRPLGLPMPSSMWSGWSRTIEWRAAELARLRGEPVPEPTARDGPRRRTATNFAGEPDETLAMLEREMTRGARDR